MAAHLERIIRIYNRLRRGPVTIDVLSKWATNAGIEVGTKKGDESYILFYAAG